ncbi:MAG TPA: DMT family transporter [Vicinamibacterales bacterium]|nr:DMT family transporter [Vicinamibacterales bacterium]
MSSSIPYALGALVLYGLADFVYKRAAAAGALPHRFLMVQTWFFTPLAVLYGLSTGTLVFTSGARWGLLAGVVIIIGYYNFAWSLRHGSVSTNATIFRLSFVVTTALAVLILGESLTAPKLTGIVLAFLAVWLLLGTASAGTTVASRDRKASLLRVLGATVAAGFGSFAYKLGLNDGAVPIALVAAQGSVAVTLATAFAAYVDRNIRPSKVALQHAPITAALLVGAFLLQAKGLERGDASVVVPIAQMGFVVSAFLGFIVLREAITARKVAGLIVAVLALMSLAWA